MKVLDHNSDTLSVTFGTDLNKSPCEASFAIDDFELYLK